MEMDSDHVEFAGASFIEEIILGYLGQVLHGVVGVEFLEDVVTVVGN